MSPDILERGKESSDLKESDKVALSARPYAVTQNRQKCWVLLWVCDSDNQGNLSDLIWMHGCLLDQMDYFSSAS